MSHDSAMGDTIVHESRVHGDGSLVNGARELDVREYAAGNGMLHDGEVPTFEVLATDDDLEDIDLEIGREPSTLGVAARVQALLFVAAEPVQLGSLARALDVTRREIERALDDLDRSFEESGLRLQRAKGAVQLVTAPDAAEDVRGFLGRESLSPLSRPALESLSIIAYRQPLTRPEIDELRGVNSDGVVRTLLARGLIEPVGRRETVGHPIEYGTTFTFLEYFGLRGLDDLPAIDDVPAPNPEEIEEGADFLATAADGNDKSAVG